MSASGRTSDPRRYDAPGRDRVLAAIRAGSGGAIAVTSYSLAEELELSRRTVRTHLDELERLGWITQSPIRPTRTGAERARERARERRREAS